jgi:hypothetical protein
MRMSYLMTLIIKGQVLCCEELASIVCCYRDWQDNVMGRTCSENEDVRNTYEILVWGNLEMRDQFKRLGLYGWSINY